MALRSPFSELVERPGILLPTLLSIIFVISLFLVAASGQNRLVESNEQIRAAEYRARRLADFMRYMVDAESAVRGYVITGDPSYLGPFERARPEVTTVLADLAEAYRQLPVPRRDFSDLALVADTRLGLLEQTVERSGNGGSEAAALLVRSDVGQRTMDQVRATVATIAEEERLVFARAQQRATADLRQGRWLLALGALLNVLLVGLVGWLISVDLKRRSQLAGLLEEQRQSLEGQVLARTEDLTELSTHLQTIAEEERSALARELHDELGSLLVAARMDLSWLQRRLPTEDPNIKLRWQRIQDSLDAGVNLKRRVVEQLRPTLLDNMGLFAALKWQLQESCGRAGLKCTESYPDVEPRIRSAAAIAIFRMAQESFTNALKHAKASAIDLGVALDEDKSALVVSIADNGVGMSPAAKPGRGGTHGLASMRHRMSALGGSLSIEPRAGGGTILIARLPLQNIVEIEEPTFDEESSAVA